MHERKVGACFPDSHDRRVGGCNLRTHNAALIRLHLPLPRTVAGSADRKRRTMEKLVRLAGVQAKNREPGLE